MLGQQVDDLALALVAPLSTDYHGRRHAPECYLSSGYQSGVVGSACTPAPARITRIWCPRGQVVQPRSCSSRSSPWAVWPTCSPDASSSSQAWQTTVKAVARARRTTVCSIIEAALATPLSARAGLARSCV